MILRLGDIVHMISVLMMLDPIWKCATCDNAKYNHIAVGLEQILYDNF